MIITMSVIAISRESLIYVWMSHLAVIPLSSMKNKTCIQILNGLYKKVPKECFLNDWKSISEISVIINESLHGTIHLLFTSRLHLVHCNERIRKLAELKNSDVLKTIDSAARWSQLTFVLLCDNFIKVKFADSLPPSLSLVLCSRRCFRTGRTFPWFLLLIEVPAFWCARTARTRNVFIVLGTHYFREGSKWVT